MATKNLIRLKIDRNVVTTEAQLTQLTEVFGTFYSTMGEKGGKNYFEQSRILPNIDGLALYNIINTALIETINEFFQKSNGKDYEWATSYLYRCVNTQLKPRDLEALSAIRAPAVEIFFNEGYYEGTEFDYFELGARLLEDGGLVYSGDLMRYYDTEDDKKEDASKANANAALSEVDPTTATLAEVRPTLDAANDSEYTNHYKIVHEGGESSHGELVNSQVNYRVYLTATINGRPAEFFFDDVKAATDFVQYLETLGQNVQSASVVIETDITNTYTKSLKIL